MENTGLTEPDFGDGYITPKDGKPGIDPKIAGFMNACYQLGSILAVPVAPWVSQRYGRRASIFAGSVIMVVGAILQGFAQHGTSKEYSSTIEVC
jgi:MFS family permease